MLLCDLIFYLLRIIYMCQVRFYSLLPCWTRQSLTHYLFNTAVVNLEIQIILFEYWIKNLYKFQLGNFVLKCHKNLLSENLVGITQLKWILTSFEWTILILLFLIKLFILKKFKIKNFKLKNIPFFLPTKSMIGI